MGLLDAWTRRAIERRNEGHINFIGAESGLVDDGFKRDLILEFSTRPDVRRAYLLSAQFQAQPEPAPTLCILSKRPDDKAIIVRIGEIVRRRFADDTPLEVLFLTAEQDEAVARITSPFYSALY